MHVIIFELKGKGKWRDIYGERLIPRPALANYNLILFIDITLNLHYLEKCANRYRTKSVSKE